VTVSAEALAPMSVPVHLSVADWALPEAHRFRAHVSLYHSPETLALKYEVPLWSEKHWELIEKSLQLLAQVGNNLVQIPLVHHTQLGNEEGWVYWVRKPDGSFDYDFTVFDRYLALVKKHLVDPEFVALHVWLSTVYEWGGKHELWKLEMPSYVTLLDPETGKHDKLTVPAYGTEESKAFWQPVLLAIKERLAKLGLEKSICLGVLIENRLPEAWTEFQEILPEAGWLKGCHRSTTATEPIPMPGGSKIVLQEHAYPYGLARPLEKLPALPRIWEPGRVGVHFFRGRAEQDDLQKFRLSTERNLFVGSRGIGRMCLDYWSVIEAKSARNTHLFNRWPQSSSAQRGPYVFELAWPGPDGPLPTLRFEAIREGLQEAEAMILLAEAQAEFADRLGEELTAECRQLFLERMKHCVPRSTPSPYDSVRTYTNHYGWRSEAG
jgi:hypothetical protein